MLPSIREGQTLREEVPSRAPSAVTDPASGVISLICIGRMFARNNEWRRYGRFRRSSFVWRMRTRFPQHSIIVGPIRQQSRRPNDQATNLEPVVHLCAAERLLPANMM